ncbi:dynamin family protein [Frederiksenia canicola]
MSKSLFEVVVVATMSAGKSTVINALIGQELLHSANEATTATITRIHDQDHLPFFSGSAYSYQNELIAESHQLDAETMKKWNADPNIKLIDIAGDIKALHNSESDIVIYDTPGPNNSQDDNHEKLTMEVINDGNFGLILYVLNATQLGVNDDRFLLEEIHKSLSKNNDKEIIFLLNKADMLDAEKGESVEKVIQHTKSYLTSIGFNTPIIIPTSASKALVCQKVLSREKITRSQLADLNIAIQDENNQFLTKPEIPAKIKLKAIAKINSLKNKKVKFHQIRNSVKISNRRLLKNYIQSGFGLVSIILQNKLSEKENLGKAQPKPKANYEDLKASNQKLTVKIEDNLHESKLIEKNISFIQPQYEGKSTMSNSIYIEHNPFTIQTIFKVNGEDPANIQFLENIREQRLQRWIEEFFPNLYNIFNGSSHFDVTFKGVEADYLDVQEAVKVAKQQGMSINLEHIKAENSESRLKKIQGLMEEAEKHPIFGEKIRHSQNDLRRNFNIALNKDFDVYVAATMSAGKSTLINAMLGCDLLPAANEATTATIAEITDNDATPIGQFEGKRINKNDEIVNDVQLVNLETLKEWNAKADTKLIKLTGNILGIKERENVRLVLTDTPGPNNSQDPEHSRTTMSFIQDSQRNPLILYILNATQLGTNDDQQVLGEISKIMQQGGKQAKDRFIFVVNKMDQFDPESGEDVKQALGRVKQYLINNGIENPQIYPVSANFTRLLRKRETSPDSLTRKERNDLNAMEDLFTEEPSMDFIQYMPLTSSVRSNLKEKHLSTSLTRSGLPAIESMIDEYIDKYNFPNRVNRAYQALSEIIKIAGDESQLSADLQTYVNQLGNIKEQIQALENNKNIGVKAKAKMTSLITRDHLIPRDAVEKFDLAEAEVRKLVYDFQDEFLEDAVEFTKAQARRRLDRLTRDVTFQSNRLINNLDNILVEGQEVTRHKLTDAFNEYVKEIFNDLDIPMPILEGLKSQVSSLASLTNLGLQDDEIEVRVTNERVKTGTRTESYREKVGTREVSTSRWYNPFSWGSSRTEDVYETRYKEVDVYENREKREEYVDANELWENRESEVMQYFNDLMNAARDKLENDVLTYANSFKDFMEKEFKVKFDEIMSSLKEKLADEKKVNAQAEDAKKKLAQIKEFEAKLEAVHKL